MSKEDIATGTSDALPEVNWRRNLLVVWLAQFSAILSLSAIYAFLPLFIYRDLNVHNARELAFWAGAAAATGGLGQAVGQPIWGIVADRVGRKPMLVRAMMGGGVIMLLTAAVQTPKELVGLRFLHGLLAGPRPIAIAIVASATPRERIPWALSTLQGSVSLGAALGPALGALLVVIVAIRETFVIAGISLILSAALVIAFVQESSRATRPSKGQPEPAERVDFRRTIIPMLAPLLSVQMVIMTVSSSMFPLMALRFLSLDAAHATLVTGVGFAVSGGASAISAMQASRIASAIGYRRACVLAAVGTCATLVAIVSIRSVPLAVAFYFLYGLANGLLLPLTTVLIGLQVPLQMHSTVFGLGGTAQAIGITVGPLLAGGLASFGGVSLALVVLACSSALLAAAMRKVLREPDAAGWVAAAAPTPAAPDSA